MASTDLKAKKKSPAGSGDHVGAGEAFLPAALLRDVQPHVAQNFRNVLRRGGLRLRKVGGRLAVRADPSVTNFIALKPLLNADGKIRADAEKTLRPLADQTPAERKEMAEHFRKALPAGFVLPNSLQSLEMNLLSNVDDVAILKAFLEKHEGLSLFALRTTEAFHFRDVFWRLCVRSAEEDIGLVEMEKMDWYPTPNTVSGIAFVFAGHLVCPLLTAREQPFASVTETLGATQVVVVAPGVFDRHPHIGDWPSGAGYHSLMSSGADDVYETRNTSVPLDEGEALLKKSVAASNALVGYVNDPAQWVTDTGELATLERLIAWSTIDFGLNTVASLARDWGSSESVWTAFRALGTVSGFWGIGPDDVFDPERIKKWAVSFLPAGFHREWGEDVAGNWDEQLKKMYPSASPAERVDHIRELRNLLHGTGVPAKEGNLAKRRARIDALLGTGDQGLQLIRDIAAFWWGALLFNPKTHANMGRAPWTTS